MNMAQAIRRGRFFRLIPLLLTISRLFIAPLFFVFYVKYAALSIPFFVVPFILLGILAYSELTDFLDGYLARKFNLVSELGKLLDPMADSITRISILFILTQGIVSVPIYWVLFILYRDLIISTLRTLCALKGLNLAARMSGKLKAALQGVVTVVIVALMIPYSLGVLPLWMFQLISKILVACASCYTLFSGLEYMYANRGVLWQFWPGAQSGSPDTSDS